MAEEKKGEEGNLPVVTPDAFAKLQEQVGNLNKGIASYRDESKSLKEKNEELSRELESLKSKVEETEEEGDEEVPLNPEDEKKLEAWAHKKGFVSQQELVAERQKLQLESIKSYENQAVSEFITKHPEYDTDESWQKVLSEFQMYRQPTSVDGYRKLLDRIHKDLSGGVSKAREEGRTREKIESSLKGRLSLGGGPQGGGGADEEIEKLSKRYPNLSREQIEERLSEIRSLQPKK